MHTGAGGHALQPPYTTLRTPAVNRKPSSLRKTGSSVLISAQKHLQKKAVLKIWPKIGCTGLIYLNEEKGRAASMGVCPAGTRAAEDSAESPLQSSWLGLWCFSLCILFFTMNFLFHSITALFPAELLRQGDQACTSSVRLIERIQHFCAQSHRAESVQCLPFGHSETAEEVLHLKSKRVPRCDRRQRTRESRHSYCYI